MGINPLKPIKELGKQAGKAVKGAAEATVKVAVAGPKAVIDLASGKSVTATAKEFGATIGDAASAVAEAANTPNFFVINLAKEIGGDTAAGIAMVAVGGQVIQNSLPAILATYLNKPNLKPEDILTLPIDVILAALLSSAADQLRPKAKPVPLVVKLVLKPYFPAGVIEGARYAIGKVGITLPEAINGMQTFMGEKEHAVTVPGIIVFSQEPDGSEQSIRWWAHELQHIVQYNALGVNGFASEYIKNSNELEGEANAKAASVVLTDTPS
jgi:hypothetical protein